MKKIFFMSLLLVSACKTKQSNTEKTTTHNQSQTQHVLKLYVYNWCPSCKNVKSFLKKHNLSDAVTIIDADQEKNYEALKRISGRDICPYLVNETTSEKIGDSVKIIAYLKKHFHIL